MAFLELLLLPALLAVCPPPCPPPGASIYVVSKISSMVRVGRALIDKLRGAAIAVASVFFQGVRQTDFQAGRIELHVDGVIQIRTVVVAVDRDQFAAFYGYHAAPLPCVLVGAGLCNSRP